MQFLRSLKLYRYLCGRKWYQHRDDAGRIFWFNDRETRRHHKDISTGVSEDYRRSFAPYASVRRCLRNLRWYRKANRGSWRLVSYGAGKTWVRTEETEPSTFVYDRERWGERRESRKHRQLV